MTTTLTHSAPPVEVPTPAGTLADTPRRRPRWRRRSVIALVVFLLLPVPWMHVVSDSPPGSSWRLDGRLRVDGQVVDPPGSWSWLTVGRPPLVAEVLRDLVLPGEGDAVDMRDAPVSGRPALNEPAAAAVGLRHAGVDVPLGLLVEARKPTLAGYPEVAIIVEAHGIVLSDREQYEQAHATAGALGDLVAVPDVVRFRTADGREFEAPGPWLPYERVSVLDLAPESLEASISGPFARLAELAPVDWFRNLNLGSSHGTMVALLTYVDASGRDLAQGRHVAGTGGIRGDGVVTRIGGLEAKARAAKRAGADVLLFPASQASKLDDFDPGNMALVPIETLADAIAWLEQPLL